MNFFESDKLSFPTWLYHWHENAKIFQNKNEYNAIKYPKEWFDCPRKACLYRYTKKTIDWTPAEAACLLSGIDPRRLEDLSYKDFKIKINDLEKLINKAMEIKNIKSDRGLIKGYDCIKWAKLKNIHVPEELEISVRKNKENYLKIHSKKFVNFILKYKFYSIILISFLIANFLYFEHPKIYELIQNLIQIDEYQASEKK